MKYIVTESQYKILTEDKDNDFEDYLTKRFPKINDLKMETSNTAFTGLTRSYFDPEKNELYFRVALRTSPDWKPGIGQPVNDEFIRLYVDSSLYDSLENYIGNFEEELLRWFNDTYKEDADRIIPGIR